MQPVLLGQLFAQCLINGAQMRHIRRRILDLRLAQRSGRPVAEPMRLVDRATSDRPDQTVIPNLIAKPGDHRRNLRIENRRRQTVEQMQKNFQILARRVKNFHTVRIGQKLTQRGKVQTFSERIDQHNIIAARKLHQAQLRPICPLSNEFRVDRHERLAPELFAETGDICALCQKNGRRKGRSFGSHDTILQQSTEP